MFNIVVVNKKAFQYLVTKNCYLIAITICALLVPPFLVSPFFLYAVVSTNEFSRHLNTTKDPYIKIKGLKFRLVGNKTIF